MSIPFPEALEHLKSGNIITRDNKNFHFIEDNKIKTTYFFQGKLMIIQSDLENCEILNDDWSCLNESEVEELGIRRR